MYEYVQGTLVDKRRTSNVSQEEQEQQQEQQQHQLLNS